MRGRTDPAPDAEGPLLTTQLTLPLEENEVAQAQQVLEGRRLRALAQEWSPEALGRFFVLTPADLTQIKACRGPHNRLGFGLQMVLLRFLHFPLPALTLVPEAIVRFVSLQLGVDPQALAAYGQRAQTRYDHQVLIRTYLGLRAYSAADGERMLSFLVSRAWHRDEPAVLVEEAEEWLRRERLLFPSVRTLYRLIGQARAVAEEQIHDTITRQLTAEQRAALDGVLEQPYAQRGFLFAWFKEPPRTASAKALVDLLRKRAAVRALEVGRIDLSALNRNRLRRLANLGRSYFAPSLKRFAPQKRYALLVCTLQDLEQSITDDIVEMLDVLIGRIFHQAEEEMNAEQIRNGKTINTSLLLLRQAATVLLDKTIPDPDVRRVAFRAVPEAVLQQAVDNADRTLRPADYNHLDFVATRYGYLRTFLPALLDALPFTGTQAARPVLEAIAVLKDLGKKRLPADAPLAFIDAAWRSAVVAADGQINRPLWELCLAEAIRNGLRSSDLHVVGSRQHRDWMSYLHTPAAWAARREISDASVA